MEIGDNIEAHAIGYLDGGLKFLDTHKAGQPIRFTIGAHRVFPAFERAILDMAPGEMRTICIPAAEAYGDYDESLIERIPKAGFPGWENLPVGQFVEFESDGGPIRCKVLQPEADCIVLDHNHELAGQDLFYDIELIGQVPETAIQHELHAPGCACGCDRLKESLAS